MTMNDPTSPDFDFGSGDALKHAVDWFIARLEANGRAPDRAFRDLTRLLGRPDFQSAEGSWHLIVLFERYWSLMSERRKNRLLHVLEATFASFKDPVTWFLISEILGEYYHDEAAFDVLCRLDASCPELPRSLVPHGLEHLIKNREPGSDLYRRAYRKLNELALDLSETVRYEVTLSLERLQSRGLTPDSSAPA
jgi:hypothetical protein